MTKRGIQGQGGTYNDKEGCNDLAMTEGDGHTGTRRVVMTW